MTLDCFGSGDPMPVIDWLRGDTILPILGEQVMIIIGRALSYVPSQYINIGIVIPNQQLHSHVC